MKQRILAELPNGIPVEITGISSTVGMVEVTALDNHEPFLKYDPYPRRSRFNDVSLEQLADIRVEDDPFEPDDSQPEIEPKYDPYVEYVQMTNELRHGLA